MELLEGVPLHYQFPHPIKLYPSLKTEILQNVLVHVYTFVTVMISVLFVLNIEDCVQNFELNAQ
jgi:hypothetical protein